MSGYERMNDMTRYLGNGAYCYANSASMLLSTIGEDVEPGFFEVMTGFALGAFLSESNRIFFDSCSSSPDEGVNRAFDILGFHVQEKVKQDGALMPLDELREDLAVSPIMLGPLDMGHLTYNPNYRYVGGSDHYVLALDINVQEIMLHDPAGYPYVWLPLEQLDLAWKAERIKCSQGSYRYWLSPERIESPSVELVYERSLRLFQSRYKQQAIYGTDSNYVVGTNAILAKAEHIRSGNLVHGEIEHLIHFALPLGAKRAMDFSRFFAGSHTQLAHLKELQARLFGKCQSAAMLQEWCVLADTLEQLSEVEGEFEAAVTAL